jgi:hypothetical protein
MSWLVGYRLSRPGSVQADRQIRWPVPGPARKTGLNVGLAVVISLIAVILILYKYRPTVFSFPGATSAVFEAIAVFERVSSVRAGRIDASFADTIRHNARLEIARIFAPSACRFHANHPPNVGALRNLYSDPAEALILQDEFDKANHAWRSRPVSDVCAEVWSEFGPDRTNEFRLQQSGPLTPSRHSPPSRHSRRSAAH